MALLSVALVGMVALSVDIGSLTVNRRFLQNADDAAALAGAQELPEDENKARARAESWLSKNGVGGSDTSVVTISSSKANSYIASNKIMDTIQVQSWRTVSFGFARALNISSGGTTTLAKVQVGSIQGGPRIMPFGIKDENGPGREGFGYEFEEQVTIRKPPGNTPGPGNYGILALDGGTGGDNVREIIAQGGSETRYRSGEEVRTEPGIKNGPVRQGFEELASSQNPADTLNGSPYGCDNWETAHTYVDGQLDIKDECEYRVVLVPIIHNWPNGRGGVTILGFAQMYVESVNGNDAITGYFLKDNIIHPDIIWGPLDSYGTRVLKIIQ